MTSMAVELVGLDTVDTAVGAVVQVLTDPDLALAGTQLIGRGARPPVDTGRLADSLAITGTGTGAQLVYLARYAPIVHARQPWLGDAISAALPELVALYETNVLDAWD